MTADHSELRIPADLSYIVVAKRAAAGFASVAGLDVEAVDDVVIAVAQACEHAISRLHDTIGDGAGQLRLEFQVNGPRLDIQVRSVCSRAEIEMARRRALHAVQARHEVRRQELALQLMGLLVDEFGYRSDDRTGAFRVRLTKYRVL